jgi:hypothetical protein
VTIPLTVTQVSNEYAQLDWQAIGAPSSWLILRQIDSGAPEPDVSIPNPDQRLYLDPIGAVGFGQLITYTISSGPDSSAPTSITKVDRTVPYTYGPVLPLASTIRYTSLAAVKARLGITVTVSDAQLTEACIAAETAIDQILGRSFPDTGVNPEIQGVPAAIASWATDAAIAVWKAADAPFGSAGSESWIGVVDVTDQTMRVLRHHPLALGYKVTFGVA